MKKTKNSRNSANFWEIPEFEQADTARKRKSQRHHADEVKVKEKKEKEVTQYVQDYINIKDIRNGIIETLDGNYVKILEVEPINFMLRSPEEQDIVIYNYASWLRIANIDVQFKSITKKADTERHLKMLKKEIAKEPNEQTKELAKAYIKLVKDVGSKEALTRRFFIILKYEPTTNTQAINADYNDIYKTLTIAAQDAKKYLSKCGNSIVEPENEDVFLCEILYMFYNRRSSVEESFKDRVKKVVGDTMVASGRVLGRDEPPAIPVVNYIAPRGLDLTHTKYIVMDGMYFTFVYLDPDQYPDTVHAGWMSSFVNAGDGIDVDLFFHKMSTSKIRDKVLTKVRLNNIKRKHMYDTSSDYDDVESSINSGYYISKTLKTDELIYMSILITISAKTYDALMERKRAFIDYVKAQTMDCHELPFRQEQALNSVTPLLQLDKDIYKKSRINIMTTDAASTYMFTSFEMSDDNGILLGINQFNSSLCILDIFNSRVYKNANMCILGTSGAGKTFTIQLMALRMRMRGIQSFIIAPLKGHEFRRACNNIGGKYVKINAGSPQCINIMEIRVPDRSADILLEGQDSLVEDSLLAKKMQQLTIFFSLLIADMTNEEAQLLDEAVIDTYARKGITTDNSTLYDENDPSKLKEMPILGDLYVLLDNNPDTKRLATILGRFVKGSAKSFNQQTNVDLNNKYIVFDISELQGSLLPVGMFIVLDYVWDKVKEDRTKKKAVFIDEIWKLIGASSNKFAAEFVLEIWKIIRGYGGAAIAGTQDLTDFFALEDGKYGKGIINNSKTKIILNLEPDEADTVRDSLKLSDTEYTNIVTFERGEGLIASNNNKVRVHIKPSKTEEMLITTDRAELEAQAKEKVAEARRAEKKARDEQLAAKRKQAQSQEQTKTQLKEGLLARAVKDHD